MALGADASAAGAVTRAQGYRAGAVRAGIKESGAPDLALLVSERAATAAAVFTQNAVQAAPLAVSRAHLAPGSLQAVVINAGNANCATGERGRADAEEMARLAASRAGCAPEAVFVNSTGVIGKFLPMDRIRTGLAEIEPAPDGGAAFAEAITTTDTHVKEATAGFEAGGRRYVVGGCAKGAGMIHPDMATMIAVVTTDAPVERAALEAAWRAAVDVSLNMVTVDGDTSTNDTALVLANGAAGGTPIVAGSGDAAALEEALTTVCTRLARMIAADGEGATKLIEMTVTGAAAAPDARAVARNVVRSPLLKAALSKGDPNWGRVLMAAGYAGVPLDPERLRLWLGDRLLFAKGATCGVPEEEAAREVSGPLVRIRLDLAAGEASATAWGCDLTEEYVRFNADYVT